MSNSSNITNTRFRDWHQELCLEVQDEADATGEFGVDFQTSDHAADLIKQAKQLGYPGHHSTSDFVRFYNLPATLSRQDINGPYNSRE